MLLTKRKEWRFRFKPTTSGFSAQKWKFIKNNFHTANYLKDKRQRNMIEIPKMANQSTENEYLNMDTKQGKLDTGRSERRMKVKELIQDAYSRISIEKPRLSFLRSKSTQLKLIQGNIQSLHEAIKPAKMAGVEVSTLRFHKRTKELTRRGPKIKLSDYSDFVLPTIEHNEELSKRYSKLLKQKKIKKDLLILRPVVRQDLMKIKKGAFSHIDMKRTWIRWSNLPANLHFVNPPNQEKYSTINKICKDIKTILYDPKWVIEHKTNKSK